MEKWLNSNLSKEQNDINDLIRMFVKKEKPSDELIHQEPFLNNPFGFYSSYISLSLRDRESIIGQELQTYYRSIIEELKYRLNIKDKEMKASSDMNNYYTKQLNTMASVIDDLKQQVDDLKKDLGYEKHRYEKTISDMNKDFMTQKVQQSKNNKEEIGLLLSEIKIREQIQLLLCDREINLKEEIAALKQILMVPKLQYKYIENMKLDELKEENKKIVKRELKKMDANFSTSHSTKNTYRPLPRHKRGSSEVPEGKKFSNFGFGERSRKLSNFLQKGHNLSPNQSDEERLPTILNKTTDSTITSLRSFRYDASSPALDYKITKSISQKSSKAMELKRRIGNASQIQISPKMQNLTFIKL
jgi:hypothetical protein